MIQYYGDDGKVTPATLVSAGPITVSQVKNKTTDGYNAVQVGYQVQKTNRVSKPVLGHLKEIGPVKHLKEFRLDDVAAYKKGDIIDLSIFTKGDKVETISISKGKGFQGVVKRHGFAGGRRSHGQKHSEREPGSIGGGLRTRIPKGMRMAGRMGSDQITTKNLRVLDIDTENNVLVIKGAIPGKRGTLVEIRSR